MVVFKYPNDTSKFFIKRIIGLPGETISIDGSKVSIETKDGEKNRSR
ncbi:MAG: S26 family signal peptidase [Candidatus Paceibacterota bacterium]